MKNSIKMIFGFALFILSYAHLNGSPEGGCGPEPENYLEPEFTECYVWCGWFVCEGETQICSPNPLRVCHENCCFL